MSITKTIDGIFEHPFTKSTVLAFLALIVFNLLNFFEETTFRKIVLGFTFITFISYFISKKIREVNLLGAGITGFLSYFGYAYIMIFFKLTELTLSLNEVFKNASYFTISTMVAYFIITEILPRTQIKSRRG